jgi:large repetitive protein
MRSRKAPLTALAMLLAILVPASAADDAPSAADDAPHLAVVINEVCWAGAPWDATAEWIELFNTTDEAIDLEGWSLVSSDGAPHILLYGIISPRSEEAGSGYFLLERDSDESVPGIAADLIYSGALTNSGEVLALIDADGRVSDTANLPPGNDPISSWPAGSAGQGDFPYASMERIQHQLADDPENWASSVVSDAEDSSHRIPGTPKAENSVYNLLPVAHVIVTPMTPHPGLPAEFDASHSSDPNDSIATYHWQFGDGHEAEGALVTHTYTGEGEYVVTLTLTDSRGGQTRLTRVVLVTVTIPPVADFSVLLEPHAILPRAGQDLTFQDESSAADSLLMSWDWDFGDGHKGVGPRVSHAYASHGDFIVALRVLDAMGNVDTQTQSLSIASQLPVAAFDVSSETPNQLEPVCFDAGRSFDPDGEIVLYRWDFDGDGVIDLGGAESSVTYEYAHGGRFTASLEVIDDTSQTAVAERTLDVNALPVAQFEVSSFEVEELEVVSLRDLSTDSDGDIVQWRWDFGDGHVSDQASPNHAYQQSGLMEITLTVTDSAGATGRALASITVSNLPPVAALKSNEATLPTGSRFAFDASASLDPSPQGGVTRYEWSLGTDSEFTIETSLPTLSHAFTEDGRYTIQVRVTDSSGATAVSDPICVTVTNRPPVISQVTFLPLAPMDGETVTFTLSASDPDGVVTGWSWTADGIVQATTQAFSHAFATPGAHDVTVHVRDDDSAMSDPRVITVLVANTPPVASFTVTTGTTSDPACMLFDASESYDPSPTGRIVHMAWDFGDGTRCPGNAPDCPDSERRTPSHCYSSPGAYIVTLVVIDEHGALSSTQQTVLIHP